MKKTFDYLISNTFLCIVFSSLVLLIFGIIDWLTGYELSFQFFYFIPLSLFSFNIRFKKGSILLFAIITSLVWFLADFLSEHVYSSLLLYVWNTLSRLIVFSVFSLFLNSIMKHRAKIELLNNQLITRNLIVTESIKYAKTIQDSIIPSFLVFSKIYPNSFIINQPKDILSGDFFWFHEGKSKCYFAVIDCTGHGVPGSLLSIISNTIIHKIIIDKEISNPDEILKLLHEELVNVLSIGDEIINDGLEISLVQYDKLKKEICISQTTQGLIMITADKSIKVFESKGYTIGGLISKLKGASYTSEKVKIEQGSWLYIFSDGLIDQFGSEENIKFGYENLIDSLLKVHQYPTNEQLNLLSKTIENWKGETKQIDDILLVGIGF